jgi:hypothetical protein
MTKMVAKTAEKKIVKKKAKGNNRIERNRKHIFQLDHVI